MNFDPSTWIIGIGPIAFFFIGTFKVWQLITKRIEPNNSNMMSVFGVAGGFVVLAAWLTGYVQHRDFDFWKLGWLTVLGTAVIFAIGYAVMPQSKFGREWSAKIRKRTRWEAVKNIVFSILMLALVWGLFWFIESMLSDGRGCGTSLRCNASELLLGARASALGGLWFFSLFSVLITGALLVNVWLFLNVRIEMKDPPK